MLNGLNTQFLKVFAETAGIPINPAVLGMGTALGTGAGIYKMMKNARQSNEEAITEDRKNKDFQRFIPNAKLTSYYTPYVKTLLRAPTPAIATVNLLSALLSVQLKMYQLYQEKETKNDGNIYEKKDDDRSIGKKVGDAAFKLNYKLNPFAQLFTYVFQGLTPSAVAKIYGFNDKKEYKEQMKKAEERSENLGINLTYAQLLGMTGSQLLRNKGKDGLMAGIFDMSKMISETLLIIKLKGFGIGRNVRVGEADEKSSFLSKMLKGIMSIPGVNSVGNIIKTSAKIAASPFTMFTKAGVFFEKAERSIKNFLSGGLYKAQDEKTLMKNAGFGIEKEYIKTSTFPNTLNKILQASQQTAGVLYTLTDAYLKKNHITADLKNIYHNVKAKIYSKYSGTNVTKEQYDNQRMEMYSRNYGGIVGNARKLWLGFKTINKSADEYRDLERKMVTKAYGKVIGEKDQVKARERMTQRESRLAGEDDINRIFSDEKSRNKHVTGQTKAIGAWGAAKTFGNLGLGLASGLASGGLFGVLSAVGGLIESIRQGKNTEDKYRKSEKDYLKSRLAQEGGSVVGFSPQKLQDVGNIPQTLSSETLVLKEIKTALENMYTGTDSINTISKNTGNLYTLIDTTINSIKTQLLTLKTKAIELVDKFKEAFLESTGIYAAFPRNKSVIEILKFYAADSYKKSSDLKQIEIEELKELRKLSGIADSFTHLQAAATGGPQVQMIPGTPPSDKTKDDKLRIKRTETGTSLQPVRSGEVIFTQEQFQTNLQAISKLAKREDNLLDLAAYFEKQKENQIINENVLKVLQDIRENTKDPSDTNRIIETIKKSQPDPEERKIKELEESSRWNKLIEINEESKDTLKGKVSYFLRDMWEDVKFKKKKKEEEKSSGLFGLLGGLLAPLGALLAKMFLGNKLLNNPITRMFGGSLWLLIKDFFKLLKWSMEGVWKLVTTPIKKVGGWLIDKFKEHIVTPIKKMFSNIGNFISEKFSKYIMTPLKGVLSEMKENFIKNAIDPLKGMFSKIGKFFKGEGTSFLSKMFGKIFGPEGLLKSIGKIFTSEGFIGKLFTSGEGGGFIGNIVKRIFGEEGILKGVGKLFGKIFSSNFLKGLIKRLPGINMLFMGWDAFQGWKDAAKITGDSKPGFIKKLGAGVAGVLSGVTWGLVEPKTIYDFMAPAINWIGDSVTGIGDWLMNTKPVKMVKEFLGYTENDPNPEESFLSRAWRKIKEISKDAWNYMCGVPYIGVPFRLLRDSWNFLFESKQNAEGEFEPSFISNMWSKLKEITGNVFDFMKTVPIIGGFYRTLGDTYDYFFGEKDPDKEPTFISKTFDIFKSIAGGVFEFMKTVPFIGAPFRILSDAYDFFFNVKPEDKQKSFFERIIEFFQELTPDSILSTILGPAWGTVKDLYKKMTGNELVENKPIPKKPPKTESTSSSNPTVPQTPTIPPTSSVPPTQEKSTWETVKEMGSAAVTKAKEVGSSLLDKGKSALKSFTSIDTSSYKPLSEEELKKDNIKVGEFKLSSTVYKAIQAASDKYGVPLVYMLAKAAQESGFDPNIKAKTSSATGLYQFITGTWDEMWKGVSPKPDRRDPFANADAGARYALKSKRELGSDDPAVLYLGHFMGQGGAKKLLNALSQDPNTPAKNVVTESQMRANASIFKPGSTVQDIYNWSGGVMNKWMKKIGGKELPKLDTKDTPTSFKGESKSMFESVVDWGKDKINSIMTPATPPTIPDIKSKYKDELTSIEPPKQTRSSQEVAPVGNLNIQKDVKELQTNKMTQAEEERKIIVNLPPQQQSSPTLVNVNNPTNVMGGQQQSTSQAPIDPSANALIDKLFSSTIFAFTDSLGKKFVGNELTTSLAA